MSVSLDPNAEPTTDQDWQVGTENQTLGNVVTDALRQQVPLAPVVDLIAGTDLANPLPKAVQLAKAARLAREKDAEGQAAVSKSKRDQPWGSDLPLAPIPPKEGPGVGGGFNDFGLGGIQSKLLSEADKAALPPAMVAQWQDLVEQRKKLADEQGASYGEVMAKSQALLATQESMTRVFHQGLAEAKTKMDRAAKKSLYPTMSLDDINRLEGISADTTKTPEQRRAAELQLQRAQTIDPNRLFADNGNKLLAALAVAAGSFASSMSHGRVPNFGLQLVNDAIDRDVLAQKIQFEQVGKAYERSRTTYSDMFKEFESEEMALAATRATLTDAASKIALKYGAKDTGLALEQKAAEMNLEIYRQNASKKVDDLAKAAGVAAHRGQLYQEELRTEMMAQQRKEQREQMALPGGAEWVNENARHLTPSQAKPAFKIMEDYNAAQPLLDQVTQWRRQYGAEWLNRVEMSKVRAWHAELVSVMRQIQQTGAHLSKEEKVNIDRAIGADPTDLAFILPALQATKKALQAEYNGKLKAYGMKLTDMEPEVAGEEVK